MSENSVWKGLASLLGGGDKQPVASPLATSSRRCEAGHPMAIDWEKCPYCEAAKNAAERTRGSGIGVSAARETRVSGREAGPSRRQTFVDTPATGSTESTGRVRESALPSAGGARRNTMVIDAEDPGLAQAVRRQGSGRRLTGIVVTFSWSPLGQLFTVHEGRNYVGSGRVSIEADRPADVLVPEDDRLSSAHFLILCQGKEKYRISDCNSTNGTYVNGELIDSLGIDLADGALIQAGATLFTFQKVRPPSGGATSPKVEPEADPVQAKTRDSGDEDRSI